MLWKYGVGMFFSSPVVVQDRLFTGGGALNAKNGRSIWNCTVGAEEGLYCPAVANGMVYIGSTDWNIYALDASTGDEVWKSYAGDQLIVPMVAKGVVYAFLTGAICALDADSGAKIWNYSIPYLYWSPGEKANLAAENDIVYAASPPENLYALNAASGALVWNFTFSGKEISAPTVVNDVVYLGSTSGLYALNGTNGELLWNYTRDAGFGSPVVVDSVAYVGDFYDGEDNQVYAIAVPSPQLPEREPFPTVLVAIASIGLIAGIGAGLLVYFKKRKH
jgi:outer membrane protein assembly factor BamB